NPKQFVLGGMDNWVGNQTDVGRADDPLRFDPSLDNSNILFTEFVTNMRGYNYNKMSGENVLLGNFELRLPIFKYIFGNRIRSSFFNNLQLVGFYDIGTAWTGVSPFNRQNSVNTRIIGSGQSVFTALVNDFKNPWLQGYGAGLRTIVFGYYVKFDVGMPVEDFIVGPEPKYYLTIGYDF
ncbi:MAG: translocation protein TolB, partial [Cytophagales bacterium]